MSGRARGPGHKGDTEKVGVKSSLAEQRARCFSCKWGQRRPGPRWSRTASSAREREQSASYVT